LEAIRAGLPERGVLIDMARFEENDFNGRKRKSPHYVAWVTPKRGAARVIDLGDAQAIDALVADVQRELAAGSQRAREKGEIEAEKVVQVKARALAARLLDPLLVIDEVRTAEHWVLSPDGHLWLVPWAALPLPNGKYAVEQYPSAPLIVADPDFDLSRDAAAQLTQKIVGAATADAQGRSAFSEGLKLGHVRRLPGTAAEAELIAPRVEELLQLAPRLHVGEQALESVVKAALRPRLLVLSTHGFFLPAQEVSRNGDAESFGSENSVRSAVLTTDGQLYEDPLLRCGLLLAACNDQPKPGQMRPGDDGVLTGLEVVTSDLRGCELVVLSACATGLGDVRSGEGVAGLRQAFQLAGAESVLASLWNVDDVETAHLMVGVFEKLAAGRSRSAALAETQRELIRRRRARHEAAHPFFWAAFTLTGRDRVTR
jgi:CHAT domain-containing protein